MNNSNSLENLPCNLCGSESTIKLYSAKDWLSKEHVEFNLVKCPNCALVYINPRPPRGSLFKYYYPRDYYTHREKEYITPLSTLNAYSKFKNQIKESIRCYFYSEEKPVHLKFFNKILARILLIIFQNRIATRSRWGLIGEKGKHLDVGCGNGALLQLIKIDWVIGNKIDSVGIDVDQEAIKNANRLKVDALVANSEHIPFRDSCFDIITMKHSLEHMTNPMKTLIELYRVMKPKGKIIVEMPNFQSVGAKILKDKWSGLDAPRHLFHFSFDTIERILNKAGFKVIELKKWPGTFKTDLSLKNMQKYWSLLGYNQIQIKFIKRFYGFFFFLLDHAYRGGNFSIKAYKPF